MRQSVRALSLAALVACVAAPAHAADRKIVSPGVSCFAVAPDTAASELQFNAHGVYNPGTSIEKVMCALPYDNEAPYSVDSFLSLKIFYRVLGGAPGRVTCTLFLGSSSLSDNAIATATVSGDLLSGGERGFFNLLGAGGNHVDGPSTLVCAISPKTLLGSIRVSEVAT